jgi:hypothetical protein
VNHDDRDAVTGPASDQPGPIGADDLPLHARDYDIAVDTEAFLYRGGMLAPGRS